MDAALHCPAETAGCGRPAGASGRGGLLGGSVHRRRGRDIGHGVTPDPRDSRGTAGNTSTTVAERRRPSPSIRRAERVRRLSTLAETRTTNSSSPRCDTRRSHRRGLRRGEKLGGDVESLWLSRVRVAVAILGGAALAKKTTATSSFPSPTAPPPQCSIGSIVYVRVATTSVMDPESRSRPDVERDDAFRRRGVSTPAITCSSGYSVMLPIGVPIAFYSVSNVFQEEAPGRHRSGSVRDQATYETASVAAASYSASAWSTRSRIPCCALVSSIGRRSAELCLSGGAGR